MDQRLPSGRSKNGPSHIERRLESIIFQSRWLLAPLYIGLVLSILVLIVKFVKELFHIAPMAISGDSGNIIVFSCDFSRFWRK